MSKLPLKILRLKKILRSTSIITINDVRCAVVGGGPKVQNVLIHHYPFEEDNHRLWIALSSFGEARDIQCHVILICALSPLVLELLRWFVIHPFPVHLMWEDTCVRLGMSGNLLNAIFVKVDMFLRTALLRVSVDGV